jgi:hypothetical protein
MQRLAYPSLLLVSLVHCSRRLVQADGWYIGWAMTDEGVRGADGMYRADRHVTGKPFKGWTRELVLAVLSRGSCGTAKAQAPDLPFDNRQHQHYTD